MANYQLTQTGAEIQADLDKIEGTPTITTIGTGLGLTSGTIKATGVEYTSSGTVQSAALRFVKLTRTEYNALAIRDANTFYIIVG